MSELTIERLRELTVNGAREEPVVWELRGLTEKQRKALIPAIAPRIPLDFSSTQAERTGTALAVAVFGLLPSPTAIARALRHADYHAHASHIADVLEDRAPAWLPKLPAALLKERWWQFPAVRVIRELVRRGLVASPDDDRYALHAIHALCDVWSAPASPNDALTADPGLVDDIVWRWFTTEDAGSRLHYGESHQATVQRIRQEKGLEPLPSTTWGGALRAASEAGRVDRARLLDETVATLARDFRPKDLVWFADFHEAMAAGDAEVLERQSSYLRLLKAEYGRSVEIGLNAAHRLQNMGALDTSAFLDVAANALLRKEKKHATATLRILAELMREPGTHSRAVREAATALGHHDAGVQRAAWKLISAHLDGVDDATKAFVAEASGMAAPSVAAQIAGTAGSPVEEPAVGPPTLAAFPPPVREPEEFARLFAELLDTARAIDIERLLEASPWFAGLPDAEREKWLRPVFETHAQVLAEDGAASWLSQPARIPVETYFWLAALCDAVLNRTPPPIEFANDITRQVPRFAMYGIGQTPHALLVLRISELCAEIARGDLAPLIATPTHADGSIDEAALERRSTECAGAYAYYDMLQARLRVRRLPADRIAIATARLYPRDGYAEEMLAGRVDIAEGGDGETTESVRALAGRLTSRSPDRRAGSAISQGWGVWPGMWLWSLPGEPDVALAHWLPAFVREVETNGGGHGIAPVLDWWRISHVLDTPFALYCLTLALASTRPESRIEAAELVVCGLANGSVDAALFAEAFTTAVDRTKPGRIAEALATKRDTHPRTLWSLLVSVLPALVEARPRDFGKILTLACDSAVTAGATEVPQAVADLAREKGGTKAHIEARRLMKIVQGA
jgi:hypothetical protein